MDQCVKSVKQAVKVVYSAVPSPSLMVSFTNIIIVTLPEGCLAAVGGSLGSAAGNGGSCRRMHSSQSRRLIVFRNRSDI